MDNGSVPKRSQIHFFSLESSGPPPKKKTSGRSQFSLTFCWGSFLVGDVFLVGGFNPSEKYYSNWIISPSRGENKKYLSCHHLVFVICGVCSLSIPGGKHEATPSTRWGSPGLPSRELP